MTDLRDLYQQIIIDHSKNPRNFRVLSDTAHHKEGYNPLCGDQITLYLHIRNDVIEDVGFQGSGCAISTASASLMSEAIKGKTLAEATEIFDEFQKLITTGDTQPSSKLGKLAVLAGVKEFPMRVKCAILPWHTLKAVLTQDVDTVTTE